MEVLLICLCRCIGQLSELSIIVQDSAVMPYLAVATMPVNKKGRSSQ